MDVRLLVAALIVLGFGFTATNGVLAYRSAKRRLTIVGHRIHDRGRSANPQPSVDATQSQPGRSSTDAAVHAVLRALQSSRTSLLLAGFGLLLSTAASLWALFL